MISNFEKMPHLMGSITRQPPDTHGIGQQPKVPTGGTSTGDTSVGPGLTNLTNTVLQRNTTPHTGAPISPAPTQPAYHTPTQPVQSPEALPQVPHITQPAAQPPIQNAANPVPNVSNPVPMVGQAPAMQTTAAQTTAGSNPILQNSNQLNQAAQIIDQNRGQDVQTPVDTSGATLRDTDLPGEYTDTPSTARADLSNFYTSGDFDTLNPGHYSDYTPSADDINSDFSDPYGGGETDKLSTTAVKQLTDAMSAADQGYWDKQRGQTTQNIKNQGDTAMSRLSAAMAARGLGGSGASLQGMAETSGAMQNAIGNAMAKLGVEQAQTDIARLGQLSQAQKNIAAENLQNQLAKYGTGFQSAGLKADMQNQEYQQNIQRYNQMLATAQTMGNLRAQGIDTGINDQGGLTELIRDIFGKW